MNAPCHPTHISGLSPPPPPLATCHPMLSRPLKRTRNECNVLNHQIIAHKKLPSPPTMVVRSMHKPTTLLFAPANLSHHANPSQKPPSCYHLSSDAELDCRDRTWRKIMGQKSCSAWGTPNAAHDAHCRRSGDHSVRKRSSMTVDTVPRGRVGQVQATVNAPPILRGEMEYEFWHVFKGL